MKKILMVSPDFFNVEYAINAYMTSPTGELNKIDHNKAQSQWEYLRKVYSHLGFDVEVIKGVEGSPDMVFSANQSFPFWNEKKNKPAVILSNMRSDYRKNEVQFFKNYYLDHGYDVYNLDSVYSFEGNGDCFIRPNSNEIYGGYGFRTDKNIYNEIQKITHHEIFLFELKNEFFYHMDTCFSFLNENTIAIVPEAFTERDLNLLNKKFSNVIEINLTEAKNNFAGNCHSPDEKHVILHGGSSQFKKDLIKNNFEVIEVDTSEFMKSGGSVFCMKMMCY